MSLKVCCIKYSLLFINFHYIPLPFKKKKNPFTTLYLSITVWYHNIGNKNICYILFHFWVLKYFHSYIFMVVFYMLGWLAYCATGMPCMRDGQCYLNLPNSNIKIMIVLSVAILLSCFELCARRNLCLPMCFGGWNLDQKDLRC